MEVANFPLLRVNPKPRRQLQYEFIARGLCSGEDARCAGKYVSSSAVIGRLEKMLASTKAPH